MPIDPHAPARTPAWRRYLRMIRPDHRADLDDELNDHLESTIDALVAGGMPAQAAREEALRRFGDPARVRAAVARIDAAGESRRRWSAGLEALSTDLRYGIRALRHSLVFTTVAAASIGLGVAANATVFSVVNAILLRPIPGAHGERLQRMYVNHHSPFTWSELRWFREHATSLARVVGERNSSVVLSADGGSAQLERVRAAFVTRDYFSTLGVGMALGNAFNVDEATRVGRDPVMVLSHRYWQRRFGGDSAVIGRSVTVGNQVLTVVGVTEPAFRSSVVLWAPDFFVPFAMAPAVTGTAIDDFGGSFYTTVQLRPGVSMATAEADIQTTLRQLALTDSAAYAGRTVRLDHVAGVNAELRGGVMAGSAFAMGLVALVLLIACANVANLMLGRATARRGEIGIRLALGAGRGRLVRQMLTESFIVAGLGTLLGLAAAFAVARALAAALPPESGIDAGYFAPDGRVFAFAALLCLTTTLLCGTLPALRATSPSLTGMLKGSLGAPRGRRGMLVAVQAGMCVLLLSVAAYFVRGLASASQVNPGFDPVGVVDVNLNLNLLPTGVDRAAVFAQVGQRAAALPGVESAAFAAVVPLTGSNMETRISLEGTDPNDRASRRAVYFNIVTPGYFRTLRMPIARGREFTAADRAGAPQVAVVNETAARRLWPDGDAIGKRFRIDTTLVQVVGVSRDANYVRPGEPARVTVYFPHAQTDRAEMTLQLRTSAGVAATRRAVWAMVREVAPGLPAPPVASMNDDMQIMLLPLRAGAVALGALGGLAMLLATAGIYGVASYSVASRRRDIGVRVALGATRGQIVRMVLLESGRRVFAGATVGMLAAIGIGVALGKLLYGVRAFDPLVLGSVLAAIVGMALIGAFAPARRAAAADPVLVMKAE